MTVTAISLLDPGSGYSVPIYPADGVAAQVLDVAAPARAVAEDRVTAPGTFDSTMYNSAAAVSLSLLLYPGVSQSPEEFLDAIGPLLNPALRPALVVANDQWPSPRQLTVRYDSTAKPLSEATNWPVQITWTAPAGTWESSVLTTAALLALIPSTTGFEFTTVGAVITSAGYVFPATSQPSPSQVTSGGNAPCDWQAYLYGPCTGPALANDTTGADLVFTEDLSLGAGSYVLLDSATRAASLNSDPSNSALPYLDFGSSSWWQVQPGLNVLRYHPATGGAASQALLSFRPAWFA